MSTEKKVADRDFIRDRFRGMAPYRRSRELGRAWSLPRAGAPQDMIIRGSENIYPRDVEDVLYPHPAILEASVVVIPDRNWGEVPVAFIRVKPGHQVGAQELTESVERGSRHI
jgi:acyl-CoA synthetase (AMP-forming)/AMP-acid ligase II